MDDDKALIVRSGGNVFDVFNDSLLFGAENGDF